MGAREGEGRFLKDEEIAIGDGRGELGDMAPNNPVLARLVLIFKQQASPIRHNISETVSPHLTSFHSAKRSPLFQRRYATESRIQKGIESSLYNDHVHVSIYVYSISPRPIVVTYKINQSSDILKSHQYRP